MYRWIAYVWQAVPGGDTSEPARFNSLEAVKTYAEQYSMDMNADDIVGMLYPYTEENWELALAFQSIGNPFDYPTKVIERGKRGAFRLVNA